MLSKALYFLAVVFVLLSLFGTFRDNTFIPIGVNALYIVLSMIFCWFGLKSESRERRVALDRACALEKEEANEALKKVALILLDGGYEMRRKSELVLSNTNIKLTTEGGVVETYSNLDFKQETVGPWHIYKNEIVAFVFHEMLSTNGFYFIKTKA